LTIFTKSFTISKTTILKTLFSIPFSPKTFLFKRLLISLLISFIKIIGLVLNTLYSIIAFILILPKSTILILPKSTILILEKNLAIKMLVFIVLLFIKGFLINFLRSNK